MPFARRRDPFDHRGWFFGELDRALQCLSGIRLTNAFGVAPSAR